MKKYGILVLVSTILLSISSCKNKIQDNLLYQAQSVINAYPDSALALLDSIEFPENELKQEQYMEYLVARVQAKYKLFRNVSRDTNIFEAKRYFESTNYPREAALASFYSGCVYREKNMMDKSIKEYLEALDHAKKTEDNNLLGLIEYSTGKIYFNQNLYDSATSHFAASLKYYDKEEGSDSLKIYIYNSIGLNELIKGELDSAKIYFEKGLNLAKRQNSSYFQNYLLNNMGIAYRSVGDYEKAKLNFFSSLPYAVNTEDSVSTYLNIARTYSINSQIDSAKYYSDYVLSMLPNIENKYIHLSSYIYLTKLYEEFGDYNKALKFSKLNNEYYHKVQSEELIVAMLDMERNYNIAQKEKKVIELEFRQQFFVLFALVAILFFILAISAIVTIRRKHKVSQQKNDLLNKKIKNALFLNRLLHDMTLALSVFEREIEVLSANYGAKEKSKGYQLIQEEQKNMKKVTKDTLAEMAIDFLQTEYADQKILEELGATDSSMVFLAQCGYEFKDTATMLGVNTHALHMRKKRLEDKLKTKGYSELHIAKLYEKVLPKGNLK